MNSKHNFRTMDFRITELSSTLDPKYESEQYAVRFEMDNETKQHRETEKDALGAIKCSFELTALDSSREHVYASIKGTALGAFAADSDISEDEFETMLRINGMVTILPMLRSSVYAIANTLTIRAPMIIPNINVTKLKWKN